MGQCEGTGCRVVELVAFGRTGIFENGKNRAKREDIGVANSCRVIGRCVGLAEVTIKLQLISAN